MYCCGQAWLGRLLTAIPLQPISLSILVALCFGWPGKHHAAGLIIMGRSRLREFIVIMQEVEFVVRKDVVSYTAGPLVALRALPRKLKHSLAGRRIKLSRTDGGGMGK